MLVNKPSWLSQDRLIYDQSSDTSPRFYGYYLEGDNNSHIRKSYEDQAVLCRNGSGTLKTLDPSEPIKCTQCIKIYLDFEKNYRMFNNKNK